MAHKQLRTFHLFAGAGGGIIGDLLLGHLPVGACEIEPYPRNVLLARQRDGHLPEFPIWDDVCTLDGTPWRGSVDVLCGGFPCQDISAAGKGAGITGERSGLWKEYARLIGEMRPKFVFAENSPLLRTRGLGVVLQDLAALGYNARWGVLGARDVGAPHKRDRMWLLAYQCGLAYAECSGSLGGREQHKPSVLAEDGRQMQGEGGKQTVSFEGCGKLKANLAYAMHQGLQGDECTRGTNPKGWKKPNGSTPERGGLWWHTDPADLLHAASQGGGTLRDSSEAQHSGERGVSAQDGQSPTEPIVGRVANGVANRVDRLKALGNGQVPQCAALAFSILSEGLI